MKRSALKRKTELKAKKQLSARKPMKVKKRKAQSAKQKDCRWRSEPYLAWVRKQPCMACGAVGCDAHHVIGLGWGLSGMGLTAPDSFALSLCRACHCLTHQSPEMQAMQPDWLHHTLRAGIAQFTGETQDELLHALAFLAAKDVL